MNHISISWVSAPGIAPPAKKGAYIKIFEWPMNLLVSRFRKVGSMHCYKDTDLLLEVFREHHRRKIQWTTDISTEAKEAMILREAEKS